MSTATYAIASRSFSQSTSKACFYICRSGHPETAAKYFFAMHKCANKWAGYAEQFLRANQLAEFTESHEAHRDTQYRYTLEENGVLTVHQASFHKRKKWGVLFVGMWYDFINEFLVLPFEERLFSFSVSEFVNIRQVMTMREAIKAASESSDNYLLRDEIGSYLMEYKKEFGFLDISLLFKQEKSEN